MKNLALLALKIQNQIEPEKSVIKARYVDLVSLAFEYDGKYEEAFSYQKLHRSIWFCSFEANNLKFPGDIDYSNGQLLKYARFVQLNEEDLKFIKKLINEMDLKKEPENVWTKHFKVYGSLFLLKNGTKEEKINRYLMAQLLVTNLISSIEEKKFLSHPDLYDLVELFDGIFCYELEFPNYDNSSITNNIRSKLLFSLLNFKDDDEDFLNECKKVYEKVKL